MKLPRIHPSQIDPAKVFGPDGSRFACTDVKVVAGPALLRRLADIILRRPSVYTMRLTFGNKIVYSKGPLAWRMKDSG